MIRFLCKKDVYNGDKIVIHSGEIGYFKFMYNEPVLEYVVTSIVASMEKTSTYISFPDNDYFCDHFVRYDSRDTISCDDMMNYYMFKHNGKNKEKAMLYKMKAYIEQRLRFLKQCKEEE